MIGLLKQFVKDCILPGSLLLTRLPDNGSNTILLTFDDGPDPNVTPQVLDLLSQYKAKALFFIPGRRIERAPGLLAEIIKQGHMIGNHTYIHSNGVQPSFPAYWKDIKKCQKMIVDGCGVTPRFFRPPCGVVSLTTLLAPKLTGLRTINWSIDVKDWQCKSNEQAILAANELVRNIKSGDIVLLHDDNPCVIQILEIVLPALKQRSIDFYNNLYLLK